MSAVLGFSLFPSSPMNASSFTPRVEALLLALLVASGLLIGVLLVLNLYFLIRYRRGSSAPRPPLRIATWKFEAGWICGTTIGFLGFFFWGARIYLDMERPPANAYDVDVIGRQWMWDIRHADGRREFDTLHVPADQPVRLRMISEDVIHSFAVPAFSLKQDVVPGKQVMAWFEATRPGTYHLYCDQFCGTAHAEMAGEVVVMKPEDYAAWQASGSVNNEEAGHGAKLFVRYGCSGCHTPGSPVRAPSLVGLYGRLVPVENGQFVRADEQYLRDSIVLPQQHVVAGYAPIMPDFRGVISETDLLDLIDYLKSLGAKQPPPANMPTAPAAAPPMVPPPPAPSSAP
ncbi:MAG TPA: cytochrome c oxidase subunit II [Opitutaceae bacterium]|nr:cytochrome c oxidase subunit II [Opitutaceae bacterium]